MHKSTTFHFTKEKIATKLFPSEWGWRSRGDLKIGLDESWFEFRISTNHVESFGTDSLNEIRWPLTRSEYSCSRLSRGGREQMQRWNTISNHFDRTRREWGSGRRHANASNTNEYWNDKFSHFLRLSMWKVHALCDCSKRGWTSITIKSMCACHHHSATSFRWQLTDWICISICRQIFQIH